MMEPPGAKLFRKEFGKRPFRLLDVGSGNHAATTFTRLFPGCTYFGIDRIPDYGNDENDLAAMTQFWQMDLTQLAFDQIPDLYFDAINFAHIIEHLHNGDLVIAALLKKLRRGGVVYVEYPRLFSTRLPHMRETLNFFDDETHCRIFSLGEIYNILLGNQCRPLAGGIRRNWFTILVMPIRLPILALRRGYLVGADFWDLFGFAEYVFARKQ